MWICGYLFLPAFLGTAELPNLCVPSTTTLFFWHTHTHTYTHTHTHEVSVLKSNTNKDEALSALEVLGFSKKQAEKVIDKIINNQPEANAETLIKEALKNL